MKINIAQAFAITKNHTEAWVLQHMSFWQPKAKVQFKKRKWVVRTASEFVSDHGFPFNPETIRRAIRSLETKGLLEIRRAPHPIRPGVLRATWLRLTPKVEHTLVPIEDINKSPVDVGNHISEENSEEASEELSAENIAPSSMSLSKDDSTPSSFEGIIEQQSLDDEETELSKTPIKMPNKLNPKNLLTTLKVLQGHAYPKHPFGDLTGAAFGKAKTILNRFREDGFSDEEISETLELVYYNWFVFRNYLEQNAGMKNSPQFPTLAFLTTNVSYMASFREYKMGWDNEDVENSMVSAEDVVF